MPWLLDTDGCDRDECFPLLECYVTLSVGAWSIALEQFFRSHCSRLSSQSHDFVLRGKRNKLFFGSKSAIDSSVPFYKRLLLLYLNFKSMPKASFWQCRCCRDRSRKSNTWQADRSPEGLRLTKIRGWSPQPTARPETSFGVLATLVVWHALVSRSFQEGCLWRGYSLRLGVGKISIRLSTKFYCNVQY